MSWSKRDVAVVVVVAVWSREVDLDVTVTEMSVLNRRCEFAGLIWRGA